MLSPTVIDYIDLLMGGAGGVGEFACSLCVGDLAATPDLINRQKKKGTIFRHTSAEKHVNIIIVKKKNILWAIESVFVENEYNIIMGNRIYVFLETTTTVPNPSAAPPGQNVTTPQRWMGEIRPHPPHPLLDAPHHPAIARHPGQRGGPSSLHTPPSSRVIRLAPHYQQDPGAPIGRQRPSLSIGGGAGVLGLSTCCVLTKEHSMNGGFNFNTKVVLQYHRVMFKRQVVDFTIAIPDQRTADILLVLHRRQAYDPYQAPMTPWHVQLCTTASVRGTSRTRRRRRRRRWRRDAIRPVRGGRRIVSRVPSVAPRGGVDPPVERMRPSTSAFGAVRANCGRRIPPRESRDGRHRTWPGRRRRARAAGLMRGRERPRRPEAATRGRGVDDRVVSVN